MSIGALTGVVAGNVANMLEADRLSTDLGRELRGVSRQDGLLNCAGRLCLDMTRMCKGDEYAAMLGACNAMQL